MQLPTMNIISTVRIKGEMDGYILTVEDTTGFKDDMALTLPELSQIYQILKKRFEKHKTKREDTRELRGRPDTGKRNRPKSKSGSIKRSGK